MIGRIFPLIFIIIAAGIFFLYVQPTYTGQITNSQQQIQSYESALAAADIFTQKENTLISERNAIPAPQLERLEEFLPDGVDNIQLILDLNSLAQRSGVSLSDFEVEDNQTAPDGSTTSTDPNAATDGSVPESTSLTDSLNLSVSATGSYAAFQTFLAASEQSLRPLDVVNLSLKDSTTGVYTYTITYQIYWLQ